MEGTADLTLENTSKRRFGLVVSHLIRKFSWNVGLGPSLSEQDNDVTSPHIGDTPANASATDYDVTDCSHAGSPTTLQSYSSRLPQGFEDDALINSPG